MRARGLRAAPVAVLLGAACLLAPTGARADHSTVTLQQIADQILGVTNFAPGSPQFIARDLTADGRVDVLDMLYWKSGLLNTTDCPTCPSVHFALQQSIFDEGLGRGLVELVFDAPYTGTIEFLVLDARYLDPVLGAAHDATAMSGDDFSIPGAVAGIGSLAVNGALTADITVDIVNDAIAHEPLERLRLVLMPGPGHLVGHQSMHEVYLDENDVTWHGSFLQDGTRLNFAVDLVQASGGRVSAALISNGAATLPGGTWPLQGVVLTQDTFSGQTDPIPMPGSSTVFGTRLLRSFTFTANRATPGNVVNADLLVGQLREDIVLVGAEHLNLTLNGSFQIQRSPSDPPAYNPPLVTR